MRGRKNGCPVNIKNWLVYIEDKATNEWVRIFGLQSLKTGTDGDTEDGSSEVDVWSEPYVTKRSGSMSLEGKPVVDESTGEIDQGQEMLNQYARMSGCEADASLKFLDPYGHAKIVDYIVVSSEESTDSSGTTVSWELEQVGEPEDVPYVQVSSVALKDGDSAAATLTMSVGDAGKIITVAFTPATASNQRFRISNNKSSVVKISNVTETGFTLTPVGAGKATVTVTSINGAKTASMTVTVN